MFYKTGSRTFLSAQILAAVKKMKYKSQLLGTNIEHNIQIY